jgi:putative membrane protein
MENKEVITKAKFNPNIKKYIFWFTAFVLFISIIFIPIFIIWMLGLGRWMSKRYYNSLYCDLTNKRLRFKKGIFNKVEKTIPLENIQDLSFNENPLLRYFGLCILKIETAGQSNTSGSDMTLIGIKNSYQFKDKVLEQREALVKEKYHYNDDNNESQKVDDNASLLKEIKEIKQVMIDQLNEVKQKNKE